MAPQPESTTGIAIVKQAEIHSADAAGKRVEITTETLKFQLDALKAIRESAFQRWEKRRTYEWQTSLSIWTALAAFCATVLSGRAVIQNKPVTSSIIALVGGGITWLHFHYIGRISDHTIGDVHVQRIAEQEMYRLAYGRDIYICSKASNDKKNDKLPCYPVLDKYGFAQCWITGLLAIASIGAVLLVPPPNPGNSDNSRTTQTRTK